MKCILECLSPLQEPFTEFQRGGSPWGIEGLPLTIRTVQGNLIKVIGIYNRMAQDRCFHKGNRIAHYAVLYGILLSIYRIYYPALIALFSALIIPFSVLSA